MFTRIFTYLSAILFVAQACCAAYTNLFSNVSDSFYCESEVKPVGDGKMHLRITDGTNGVESVVDANGSRVSFRRYRNRCEIFIDGSREVSVADSWTAPVSVQIDEAAFSTEAEEYRQQLGAFSFSDSFMVAEGDTNALRDWEKISGEWSLHSVTGRTVRANDGKKLSKFPEPANSPNFYSLTGSGKCAVIAAGELFYSHYAVRAAIQHSSGTNGIAFMMTDAPSFYLFAVETDPSDGKLVFTLRDSCVPEESSGKVLKAVKTELYQGQWYMLEARTTGDEIVCSVDDVEVIRHRCELPAGGMFGLFTDTVASTRFDDVSAETFTGLDTSDEAEAEYASLHTSFDGARFFGSTDDPVAEISMPLTLCDGDSLTLSIGQQSKTALCPAYSAIAAKAEGEVRFVLQKFNFASNTFDEVDSFALPCDCKTFSAESFSLGGRDGQFVAVRLNGTTIMLAVSATPPTGAAGFSASSADCAKLIPKITRAKSKFTDQFEKNKLYVTDPFMRHWASTAGQWLTYTNNTAWYKDDVIKKVSLEMPLIDNLELHLAVPDDSEDGALRITTGTGTLEIGKRDEKGEYPTLCKWTYPSATINPGNGVLSLTNAPVTFRLDGHRFAFLSSTGSVFQCEMAYPHAGRRMFFKKIPQKYPANIIVTRAPVIDCLFSESLHDWSVNGGIWEVINRFQCLPKWSHMDGENADSLAALWSKYEFSGDFSMTFIAGMRHGWYNRMGDMNITLMNNSNSPSDGYSLSVSGWDPDESQRWSKLYRNGREIAASEKYTVPRRRRGNVRQVYEPLLASGRDVHGAWYAIRLRRNGKKLSFYFDNEKVFDVNDDEPLSSGSFGIWTYLNSMVVARVRLTADEIHAKPFRRSELTLKDYAASRVDEQEHLARPLTFNGLPVDFIRPEFWYSADDVSMPDVKFTTDDDDAVMTVTSTHGSGSFLVAPTEKIPSVSGTFLAGWTFEVARSEKALFNFEFSYTSQDESKPSRYTHVICGHAGEKARRSISGKSDIPQATPAGKKKIWTPITVWLPVTGFSPSEYAVKIDGFGNLENSDVQKGLCGNAPGEWFAIRRMRPIYRDVPVPDNSSENKDAFAEEIANALSSGKGGKLNRYEIPSKLSELNAEILWTLPPPESPGLIAEFSPDPDFMIKVKSTLPWPNPIITTSNVTVNGLSVPYARIVGNDLLIPVPRPFCPTSSAPVKVSFVTSTGRPFTQMIRSSVFTDAGRNSPPVITAVRFPRTANARYESFETRTNDMARFSFIPHKPNLHPQLVYGDGEQGTFMRIANKGNAGNRLGSYFVHAFNVTKSPWLQFRYRGDDMAFVSLFADRRVYAFSSLTPQAHNMGKATLDERWHTALCRICDAETTAPLSQFVVPQVANVRTVSMKIDGRGENQTGLFSHFDIDEISYGPALRKETLGDLAFRAEFDALSGVTAAQYAIVAGATPFDSRTDEELKGIRWIDFAPSPTNTVVPALDGLADGVYRLVIRGFADKVATPRPADIPFEIDNAPPAVAVSRADSALIGDKPALNLTIDGGNGTPPDLSAAKVLSEGKPCVLAPANRAAGSSAGGNKLQAAINWPLVMRDQIQSTTNGATVTLTIDNIADGAGNTYPQIRETFKIDYASDKTPPVVDNENFSYKPLYGRHEMTQAAPFFTSVAEDLVQKYVEAKNDQPPYLSLTVKKEAAPPERGRTRAATVFTQQGNRPAINWFSSTNRWLMLRVRVPGNIQPGASGPESFALKFLVEKTPENAKNALKGNHYTLAIPVTNTVAPPLYGDFTFQSNKWSDIVIDVDTALKGIIGTEKEVKITRLSFVLPVKPGFALDISQACIVSNWTGKHKFNLNAYDPSGIKGVFVDGQFSHDGWMFVPMEIKPPENGNFFHEVAVQDRAGNASRPLLFPFPPLPPPAQ